MARQSRAQNEAPFFQVERLALFNYCVMWSFLYLFEFLKFVAAFGCPSIEHLS